MDIEAGLRTVVDALAGAGVKASMDQGALNPPCAWVHTGPIVALTLAGAWQMTAQVTLIAKNTSNVGNLKALSELLELALTAVDPDGPIETDATAQLRDGKVLPAFTFPVNIELE
jgi:hypothetical protein